MAQTNAAAAPNLTYLVRKWDQYMQIPLGPEHAQILLQEKDNILRNITLLDQYFRQFAVAQPTYRNQIEPYLTGLQQKTNDIRSAITVYAAQMQQRGGAQSNANLHTTNTTPASSANSGMLGVESTNNRYQQQPPSYSATVHTPMMGTSNTTQQSHSYDYHQTQAAASSSAHPSTNSSSAYVLVPPSSNASSSSSSSSPATAQMSTRLAALGTLPAPGTDYDIARTLRDTLFGKVKAAKHRGTGRDVAIKLSQKDLVLRKISRKGKPVAEDPLNEILVLRHVSRLPDTNAANSSSSSPPAPTVYPGQQFICRSIDEREDAKYIWTILEFCGGGEFFDYVANKNRLAENDARHYFRQLLEGVYFLHRIAGIAHSDLSLENMLLNGQQTISFICDFGVGRRLDHSDTKRDGSDPRFLEKKFDGHKENKPGKLGYMSPELFSGESYYGTLNDLYCCGVILFISLTGVPPYGTPAVADPRFALIYSGRMAELLQSWQMRHFLSDHAFDLISHLMCPPHQRFGIEQALLHPWLMADLPNALQDPNSVYHHMQNYRGYPIYTQPNVAHLQHLHQKPPAEVTFASATANSSSAMNTQPHTPSIDSVSPGAHRGSGSAAFKRGRSEGNSDHVGEMEGQNHREDDENPGML